MKMLKIKTDGVLAGAIGKVSKPFLHISAHIDDGIDIVMDRKWHKKKLKRLHEEIKATEEQIKDWDPETVAARALKSLKSDLAMKKARLMESEALLYPDKEEEEEEEM